MVRAEVETIAALIGEIADTPAVAAFIGFVAGVQAAGTSPVFAAAVREVFHPPPGALAGLDRAAARWAASLDGDDDGS